MPFSTSPAPTNPPISILLLGSADAAEMVPIAKFVKSIGAMGDVIRTAGTSAIARQWIVGEQWHPELVIALQTWSDQFSQADVLELINLVPLARIVCVAGAWCDGDGRTQSHWPLAVRVRVAQAVSRIRREMAACRSSRGDPGERIAKSAGSGERWTNLPLTASRGEIFAHDFSGISTAPAFDGPVIVLSPDRAWGDMLSWAIGTSENRQQPGAPNAPAVVVFDADPWGKSRRLALQSVKEKSPECSTIACTGEAGIDVPEELRRAGADAVWFKLGPLESLRDLLQSLTKSSGRNR
jgi:hypothetical protein